MRFQQICLSFLMFSHGGPAYLLAKMKVHDESVQQLPENLQVKINQFLPHYDVDAMPDIRDMIMVTEFADCEGPVYLKEFLIPQSSSDAPFDLSKLAVGLMSCDYSTTDQSGFSIHKETTALLTYSVPCHKSSLQLYIQLFYLTLYDIFSRANKRAFSVAYITTNKKKLELLSYDLTKELRNALHPLIHSNLKVFLKDVRNEIDLLCSKTPQHHSESAMAENADRKRYFNGAQEKAFARMEELDEDCNCGVSVKREPTDLDKEFIHVDEIDPRSNMRPITVLCPDWKNTKDLLNQLYKNFSPTVPRLISNLYPVKNSKNFNLYIGRQPVMSTRLAVELRSQNDDFQDMNASAATSTYTASDTTDTMSYQTGADTSSLLSQSTQPDQDDDQSNFSLGDPPPPSHIVTASPDSGINVQHEPLQYVSDHGLKHSPMHRVEGVNDYDGIFSVMPRVNSVGTEPTVVDRPDVHSTPKKVFPFDKCDVSPMSSPTLQEDYLKNSTSMYEVSTKTLTGSDAHHDDEMKQMEEEKGQADVPVHKQETYVSTQSNDSFITTVSSYSDGGQPRSIISASMLDQYQEYMEYCEQLEGIETLMKTLGKKSDLQSLIYSVLTSRPILINNKHNSEMSPDQLIRILSCFVPLPTLGHRDDTCVEKLDTPLKLNVLENKLFVVLMKSQTVRSNMLVFSSYIDLSKDKYSGQTTYTVEKRAKGLLCLFSQKYNKMPNIAFHKQIHRLMYDIGSKVSLYISHFENQRTTQHILDNSEIFKLMKVENKCDQNIILNLAKLVIDYQESQLRLSQEGFTYMWSPGRIRTPTVAGII